MADVPPLVWPNGQIMQRETLTREIAAPTVAGIRSIISSHPAQGLTPPRLAQLLRQAEQGDATAYLELAEEMEEKDLHYLSVMGTRKRQVSQLPIEVIDAGDSPDEKGDGQLMRDWLERDMVEAEIFDMLDAVGKGHSATEIVWEFTDVSWLPARLIWRDPRFFEFDRVTGARLLLRDLGPAQELPAAKFIVHYHQAKSGLPIRGGIARAVAWGYIFKNYAVKDWVAFLETYGMPLRIGRYDNGETEANIRTLMGALADLGSDAAAAFPRTMDVEFVDGKGGTAPNELWKSMAVYIDDQVSKVVLGQTNTTDAKSGGMGSGQANVHNEVRGDIERADAKLLAATLNEQLVKPMVMLNRGMRKRYPRLRIGRPEAVDIDAMTKAVQVLVPMGVKVSADDVRDRAGLPTPAEGAVLLTASASPSSAPAEAGPAPAPTAGAGSADIQKLAMNGAQVTALAEMVSQVEAGTMSPSTARSLIRIAFPAVSDDEASALLAGADARSGMIPADRARPALLGPLKAPEVGAATASATTGSADPDAIDRATDDALADWELLMTPIIDPVRAVVASATGLDTLRGQLVEAIDRMDSTELVERLAQALFGARLTGDGDAIGRP